MKKNLKIFLLSFIFIFSANVNAAENGLAVREAMIPNFADTIEDVLPAVVNISTTQEITSGVSIDQSILNELPRGSVFDNFKELLENQQPKKRKLSSLGSGFIISKDGYVITNYHVIEDADEIMVNLNDEKKLKAKVIGRDKKSDLALLKIEADNLKFVKLGDSDKARIGEWVIAVGNPFGLGGSVSVGIISARGRDITSNQADDFIQTDAAINKGNSGGPLFNTKGEVIGIATAIFSPSGGNVGIGFATPINGAVSIIKQLRDQGEVVRGWLGVSIQDVTKEMAESIGMKEPRGAFVVEVIKDEPADNAGILPTDVIVKFDGKEIKEMKDLPRIVSKTPIDKKVKIVVIRQGKEKTVTARIKKMKEDLIEKKSPESEKNHPKKASAYVLEMGLINLDKKVKKENKIDPDLKNGLLVVDVKKDSKAEELGIKAGDIIISANQKEIESISDLEKVVASAKKTDHKSVLLFVRRGDVSLVVTLPVK
jgi:serine protease Do